MPQHTEATFSYDIDTISKQVIQPLSCNWIGCTATINSWLTLQKVCKLLFRLAVHLPIGHYVASLHLQT
jgi:hypothetical protein